MRLLAWGEVVEINVMDINSMAAGWNREKSHQSPP
jgi:hypothetical protein